MQVNAVLNFPIELFLLDVFYSIAHVRLTAGVEEKFRCLAQTFLSSFQSVIFAVFSLYTIEIYIYIFSKDLTNDADILKVLFIVFIYEFSNNLSECFDFDFDSSTDTNTFLFD